MAMAKIARSAGQQTETTFFLHSILFAFSPFKEQEDRFRGGAADDSVEKDEGAGAGKRFM